MTAYLIFRIGGTVLLLILAFVFWSGVGRRRRTMGRGFAAAMAALAAIFIWPVIDLMI
ncbi:hypothetical protein [Altererythrobacter sp. MTPC7]|uniref:hypothetical protein n=1 Tax=Altererythrobacter sp. MTPC7 TaxID=3056567 RepID=UPI0036F39398